MIKKGKKLSMMLLTAMILAAGSVGTVAGTGDLEMDEGFLFLSHKFHCLFLRLFQITHQVAVRKWELLFF